MNPPAYGGYWEESMKTGFLSPALVLVHNTGDVSVCFPDKSTKNQGPSPDLVAR